MKTIILIGFTLFLGCGVMVQVKTTAQNPADRLAFDPYTMSAVLTNPASSAGYVFLNSSPGDRFHPGNNFKAIYFHGNAEGLPPHVINAEWCVPNNEVPVDAMPPHVIPSEWCVPNNEVPVDAMPPMNVTKYVLRNMKTN